MCTASIRFFEYLRTCSFMKLCSVKLDHGEREKKSFRCSVFLVKDALEIEHEVSLKARVLEVLHTLWHILKTSYLQSALAYLWRHLLWPGWADITNGLDYISGRRTLDTTTLFELAWNFHKALSPSYVAERSWFRDGGSMPLLSVVARILSYPPVWPLQVRSRCARGDPWSAPPRTVRCLAFFVWAISVYT